jgi:hypothetical protein
LILGQFIGLGVLTACYVWYAAWQEHAEIVAAMSDLRAKALDYARLKEELKATDALFFWMVPLYGKFGVATSPQPLKRSTDNSLATVIFQKDYEQYSLVLSHLSLPWANSRTPLFPSDNPASKAEIASSLKTHIADLREHKQELERKLSSEFPSLQS